MTAPPHVCTFCSFRSAHVAEDKTTWYYTCRNCGTHGTEPRR